MNVSGAVVNLSSKTRQSKKTGRDFQIHYINVEGFPDPINIGFQQKYSVGDSVNLDLEKAYGEWKAGGAPGTGGNTTQSAAPAPKAGGFKSNSAPFPVPVDHPENRIMRQNALSHAAAVVAARGADASNDELANDIIDIAAKLVKWSTGQAEAEALAKLMEQGNVGE